MADESQVARDARIDMTAMLSAVLVRIPRIILVTLVALVVTYVFLMYTPRLYESSADILVEPRTSIYTRAFNDTTAAVTGGTADGVVSSQIELLKSRDTLLQVIDRTDLREVPEFAGAGGGFSPVAWLRGLLGGGGGEAAADRLNAIVLGNLVDAMTVIQQRDSRVITVTVRSEDPELAAELANAIANAHVARRAQLTLSDTVEASGWLGAEIEQLRQSVTTAEQAVADFRIENDLYAQENQTSLLDQQLSTIATQISAAQERKNTALSRAELIRGLVADGQSLEGVSDIQQSATIQQLSQEKARLQAERAQHLATLLPNHPTVRSIAAQIAELDAQIEIEARDVAAALESEAEIEASLEQSLRNELESLKGSASTATRESVQLQGLLREAGAQRDLLESYLRRYNDALSRSDVDSMLPDVRVISVAAPAVSPAWPKTTMILLAVAIVMSVGQIGLIIFSELLSGRAIVPVARPVPRERSQDELDAPPFSMEDAEPEQRGGAVADVAPERQAEAGVEAEEPEREWQATAEDADATDQLEAESEIAAVETSDEILEPLVDDEVVEQALADDWPEPRHSFAGSRPGMLDYENLASDIAIGRCRIIMLAADRAHEDAVVLAEALVREILGRGISVALVDAGSREPSPDLGVSDLSTGIASFGDVVQKAEDAQFAQVPWGQGERFDKRSRRPATLVEALSDIYEAVIVMTGRAGMSSTLSAFAGVGDRLVLVADADADADDLARRVAELEDAGYGPADLVASPQPAAA